MERADKYNVQIDKYTGLISYDNNPITDKNIIQIPYTAKLLIQELQTMSVGSKLVTPTNISNPVLFEHMNNLYTSGNGVDKNIYGEGEEDVEKDN